MTGFHFRNVYDIICCELFGAPAKAVEFFIGYYCDQDDYLSQIHTSQIKKVRNTNQMKI